MKPNISQGKDLEAKRESKPGAKDDLKSLPATRKPGEAVFSGSIVRQGEIEANVICLGGLVVGQAIAWGLVKTFLAARTMSAPCWIN